MTTTAWWLKRWYWTRAIRNPAVDGYLITVSFPNSHFSLAFAHQYNKDFQDAIKQFKLAKQRIQKAIGWPGGGGSPAPSPYSPTSNPPPSIITDALSEGKSGKSAASPEADNLRSVLEDIDRKIEDTLGDETAARSEVAAARAALGLGGGSTSIGFGDAAAAAPSSAGAPDGKTLASRMAPASSGIVETIGFGAPAAAVAPAGGAKDLSSLVGLVLPGARRRFCTFLLTTCLSLLPPLLRPLRSSARPRRPRARTSAASPAPSALAWPRPL